MRLLQKILLDSIGEYLPGLDKEQLRVDVLNGRCTVENADFTPGPVLVFADFPFRLASGHIGSLELKVPWKSLSNSPVRVCANDVSLRFEEIAFPNRLDEVREAFRTSRRRSKLRSIADGEKRASMISRLIQKLLPLILDHVEVDLRNISFGFTLADGYHVRLHFDKIGTSENALTASGSHSQHHPSDLSKVLQIHSASVDVFRKQCANSDVGSDDIVKLDFSTALWYQKEVFVVPKCEVCLSVNGGTSAVILDVPCTVSISIENILLDAILSLKKNRSRWEILLTHNELRSRPRHPPSKSARAWFRYAAQLAVINENGLNLKTLCDEYKSLHARHLSTSHRLEPAEDVRITELEELLDVDTILALRSQANNKLLVDGASSFAAGDLLSRLLFGNQLAGERETIASEIRQSLESLERFTQDFGSSGSSSRTPEGRSTGSVWTKAVVTALFHRIDLSLQGDRGNLDLSITNIRCWAELDSSLSNYVGVVTFDNATLCNGRSSIFRRADSIPGQTGRFYPWRPSSCTAPPIGNDSFVALQIRKLPLDRSMSISVSVEAAHLNFDASSFGPLMRHINHVQKVFIKFSSPLYNQRDAKVPPSKSSDSLSSQNQEVQTTICHVNFSGLTLMTTMPSLNKNEPSLQKNICCLEIRRTHIDFEINKGIKTVNLSTRADLKVGRQLSPRHQSPTQNETFWQVVDEFPITISYQRESGLVQVGMLILRFSHESTEILAKFASFMNSEFLSRSNDIEQPNVLSIRTKERDTHDTDQSISNSSVRRFLFEISLLSVIVEANDPDFEIQATCKLISGFVDMNGKTRISARDFILGEKNAKAAVQIFPATPDEYGTVFVYTPACRISGTATELNSSASISLLVGNTYAVVSPHSASRIVSATLQYGRLLMEKLGTTSVQAPEYLEAAQFQSHMALHFSIDVKSLSIELANTDFRSLLRIEESRYSFLFGKHSGSLRIVELLDRSNKCGNYSRVVQSVRQESEGGANGNTVSFCFEKGNLVLNLSGLHVVLLRSFIDELVEFASGMEDVLLKYTLEWATNGDDLLRADGCALDASIDSSDSFEQDESFQTCFDKITVCGEFIKVTMPVQKSSSGAAQIIIPELLLTLCGETQSATLRKVSLLTRPSRISRHISFAGSDNPNQLLQEWSVFLRSLDLEFTHKEQTSFQDSGSSQSSVGRPSKSRAQWSVKFLNQASVLLAPSQILVIQAVFSQLFSPIEKSTDTFECSESDAKITKEADELKSNPPDAHSPSVDSTCPNCDHLLVDVATEVISIDLLEEGKFGSVVAAIANLTCGPCLFSLESIQETNSNGNSTYVTRQRLDIHSLWLEDHRKGVPRHRELVLAIQTRQLYSQASRSRTHVENGPNAITMEYLSRQDDSDKKTSCKFQVIEPLLCHCPELIEALTNFITDSVSPNGFDGSTASSDTIPDSDGNLTSVEPPLSNLLKQQRTPANAGASIKYSISILSPIMFIPYRSIAIDEYGLKITSPSVKVSLLADSDGLLMRGSSVRSRNVHISMQQQGDVPFSGSSSRHTDIDEWQLYLGQRVEPPEEADDNVVLESVSRNGGSSSRKPKAPVLSMWTRQSDSTALAARITGLTVNIPATIEDCWEISVGGVNIDTGSTDLLHFISLFQFLSLVPEYPDTGGLDAEPMVPIDISVRNISVHVIAPPKEELVGEPVENFRLRIRGGVELRLGRDMAQIMANGRISADVLGETSGIRDQILAPCDIKVKIHSNTYQVSVSIPRSIQVTISPLTVKTIARVSMLIAQHLQQLHELDTPATSLDLMSDGQEPAQYLVNIQGVVMSLVSEEPRAHLMRLVFRDIKCYLKLATEELSWGCFDLDIADIVLEDLISWHVYGRDVDDDGEWRTWFSGTNDTSTKPSKPRLLELLPGSDLQSDSANTNAEALVARFRDMNLDDRQLSLFPCAAADSSMEELPTFEQDSLLCIRSKWQYPLQHLSVHVVLEELDLRVNSAILPSLLRWVTVLSSSVSQEVKMNAVNISSRHAYNTDDRYEAVSFVGVDRFVIEPVSIRIATKAPPRPIEQTAFRRLLDWLVGCEFMSGLTLQTTRISVSGNFENLSRLFWRVRMEYRNAMVSGSMMRQLFMQASSISTLTRVGVSTILRGNRIFVKPLHSKPESHGQEAPRIIQGLAVAIDELVESGEGRDSHFSQDVQIFRPGGVTTRLNPSTELRLLEYRRES